MAKKKRKKMGPMRLWFNVIAWLVLLVALSAYSWKSGLLFFLVTTR